MLFAGDGVNRFLQRDFFALIFSAVKVGVFCKMLKKLKKIDEAHLEIPGLCYVILLLAPILYLNIRDGLGSSFFPMFDQLDETILNYVFSARYFGQSVYEQMMCGVPAEGLKPFCPFFLPIYMIFDVYVAFTLQYVITVVTAFFGTYFCCKKLSGSSVGAFFSAALFATLPIHSIYGNVVTGAPLLLLCFLNWQEEEKKKRIRAAIGTIYYGLSTSFVLCGWAAVCLSFGAIFLFSLGKKKMQKKLFTGWLILFCTYVICNLDLIYEVFSPSGFVSHRTEFGFGGSGLSFGYYLKEILLNGTFAYEAESKHDWFLPMIALGLILCLVVKKLKPYRKVFFELLGLNLLIAVLYSFFSTDLIYDWQHHFTGMLSSFQLNRFYYFMPGIWYLLLGLSLSFIITALGEKRQFVGSVLCGLICVPLFFFVVRESIIHYNINMIKNGNDNARYLTMKNLYDEELMNAIEQVIGEPIDSYRVAHIGICPVASLMHGFSTIDGYSNNYFLEYKHTFREVIAGELERSEYLRTYFDCWGSRCYCFYHEWGDSYYLNRYFTGKINDLHLNMDKMKELNCRYILSAGEILDPEQYGLEFMGQYYTEKGFWNVWLYKIL